MSLRLNRFSRLVLREWTRKTNFAFLSLYRFWKDSNYSSKNRITVVHFFYDSCCKFRGDRCAYSFFGVNFGVISKIPFFSNCFWIEIVGAFQWTRPSIPSRLMFQYRYANFDSAICFVFYLFRAIWNSRCSNVSRIVISLPPFSEVLCRSYRVVKTNVRPFTLKLNTPNPLKCRTW